jgi:UDP-GlcNAc:undecaprenyl-phosphate GlcNAc-1-phosphate transferase
MESAWIGGLVAFLVAVGCTPFVRRIARTVGAVDHPGGRRVHLDATPRMGGVALVLAYFVGFGTVVLLGLFPWSARIDALRVVSALLAGGMVIAIVGIVDDVRGIEAKYKLLGQVIAATAAFAGGARIDGVTVPGMGYVVFDASISYVLTLGWILAFINAVNLIDGLDGLAGGVAFFAALTNCVVALFNGNVMVAILYATLGGAVLGFLFYNFNPATIFLGDTGSLFLGYILGTASLLSGRQKEGALVSLLVPVLALGLPLTDTLLAMVRRFLEKRSIFSPDRGHIHHRLLDLGVTHRRAVLILYISTLLLCAAALGAAVGRDWQVGAALLLAGLTLVGTVRFAKAFEIARLQSRERYLVLTPATEVLRRSLPEFLLQVHRAESHAAVWIALESLLSTGPFTFAEYTSAPGSTPAWRWHARNHDAQRMEQSSLLAFPLDRDAMVEGPMLRFGYRTDGTDVPMEVKGLLLLGVDAIKFMLARLSAGPLTEASADSAWPVSLYEPDRTTV